MQEIAGGVLATEVGYANGNTEYPTYEEVTVTIPDMLKRFT